jgi:hypothetical protein
MTDTLTVSDGKDTAEDSGIIVAAENMKNRIVWIFISEALHVNLEDVLRICVVAVVIAKNVLKEILKDVKDVTNALNVVTVLNVSISVNAANIGIAVIFIAITGMNMNTGTNTSMIKKTNQLKRRKETTFNYRCSRGRKSSFFLSNYIFDVLLFDVFSFLLYGL